MSRTLLVLLLVSTTLVSALATAQAPAPAGEAAQPARPTSNEAPATALDDSATESSASTPPAPPATPAPTAPTAPPPTAPPPAANDAAPNGSIQAVSPTSTQAEPEAVTALPADASVPASETGYEKGFYIQQGVNSLAVQGRVQARYTHVEVDAGPNEDAFSIARARLTLKGTIFEEGLSYKFQTDFGKGGVSLKDFYMDYCIWDKMLCVRPGQYKRPFSRQQINSSGNLEFVDRAITDKAFGAGRDIGLMLHDNYEKSPVFEYALGIFNGTGEKGNFSGRGVADLNSGDVAVTSGGFSNVPDQWHPALVLRLGYNHAGINGYSEADFEGGGLRFALAGSVESHFDADNSDDSLVKMQADLVVKMHGLSASAAVYRTSEQDGAGIGNRTTGDGGAHFQLGYLIADRFQPVARYAIVDPRHSGSDNIAEEFAFGLNYYVKKHNLKWQNDLSALNDNAADATDWRFQSQAQLSF